MGNIINSSKQQLLNKISYYIKKDGSIFFNKKLNTCKSKLIIIENEGHHGKKIDETFLKILRQFYKN